MIFDSGEIRSVGIEVVSKCNNQFAIDTAEFVITKDSEVVEQGKAVIDGHKLIMLFHAAEKGRYKVMFIYTIADEKLIDYVNIEVI